MYNKKSEIIRQKINHQYIIKVLCFEFDTILTSFDKLACKCSDSKQKKSSQRIIIPFIALKYNSSMKFKLYVQSQKQIQTVQDLEIGCNSALCSNNLTLAALNILSQALCACAAALQYASQSRAYLALELLSFLTLAQ